jgi:hypothetical protein
MRFLAFLVLISALAIAGCAAYFSIVGLTLLFVGSGVSIVVMGTALEVGKFIAVTFLKQKWEEIGLALKFYLITATVVLMFITSIGIYGYLSAGYNATSINTLPILDKNILYTHQSLAHENYWFQDLSGTLFNLDYVVKILPTGDMTYSEKINALVRLSIYIGVILALFYSNFLFLYIPIVTMLATYILYLFR